MFWPALVSAASAHASDESSLNVLRQEVKDLKLTYERRILELESKIKQLEPAQAATPSSPSQLTNKATSANRVIRNNSFNPSIGIVLNGQFSGYSSDSSEVRGFALGHEGERSKEGFAIDHSELNFSANVDDKFYSSVTAAIAEHEGDTEVELEEAYIQTLSGSGLPDGMSVKFGRALWTFGYLNEHHQHTDDFVERPLPYRFFLEGAFNDDGAEFTYVLPTNLYTEVGLGAFRGDDFPFGESDDSGLGAVSAFVRIGGEIDLNQS